jgi:hypothetical protein
MKGKRFALGVLVLVLGLCGAFLVGQMLAADATTSRVRLAHAAVGIPAVNVSVDGVPVATNVSYMDVTPYQTLTAGPHVVQIALSSLPMVPVISETVMLMGGLDATVVGLGQGLNVTATLLLDNNQRTNMDTVRLMHASPDTGAVDITVTGAVSSATVDSLGYKAASSYLSGLGAGPVEVEVRPAGQVTPVLTFTGTVETNTINTFFIMGLSTVPGSPLKGVHVIDQRFHVVYLPIVLKNPGTNPTR